ncbi:MAG TPA: lactate racemase domain-containing protein [Planctomycetota bacterium]|nr:lactate racemase domain-containing protein [Planctomycetota bacterium]
MQQQATVIGRGNASAVLSEADVRGILAQAFKEYELKGKRVLFIIPDGTRTAPIPLLFRAIYDQLHEEVKTLDFLIALGTHMPMSPEAINKLVGVTPAERHGRFSKARIFNHEWQDKENFRSIGHIAANDIKQISSGLLAHGVDVTVNKLIFDYDQLIVCGPVFPHEVAGYSGGNKYFFPGISGPEVINLTHWLGALITNFEVIGTKYTPVRAVIDRAADFIKIAKLAMTFVVKGHDLSGLFVGPMDEAWSAAADLSSQVHVIYTEKPYQTILSVMPEMYDDIWTAGKGMYKMEPVVADGGEVIIYAPHIDEISYTHGKVIDEIGYHCRDYFAKQWDKFKHHPWGVLAHSTHVKGQGTFENGIEKPRVKVTLATKISRERCEKVNLGYRDPATINPADFANREHEGVLLVKKAGEMLYRLKR